MITADIKHAFRILRGRPGYAAAAILSLALGIGASTAIFSIVDGVLLRPLPYPESERLVQMREVNERGVRIPVAEPNFVDVRARSRTLESIAQFAGGAVVVSGPGETARARAYWVSGDFFKVMGMAPFAGRGFLPEESKQGGAPVAIVSHRFWQRNLGGRPDFSGTTLKIDGPAFTVVGVMPAGFNYPREADIWVPREVEPPQTSRTAHNWSVVARVRPGIEMEQARVEVSGIGRQLRQELGKETDAADLALIPLKEYLTGDVRSGLLLILAAVGLVLLVACANAANLLLAQAMSRAAEFTVRAALGATRWRLAKQFIVENLLLTMIAGGLGVLIAFWGVDLLMRLNQGNLPRETEVSVDLRALLFTLGLSALIAVALALAPVLRFSSADLNTTLKEAGRGAPAAGGTHRLRGLLVVLQIALTLLLLVSAGLLGRSFLKLMRTDPGFQTESAVSMTLSLPTTLTKEQEAELGRFHQQLLERMENFPGLIAAGCINALPLTGRGANGTFLKDNNPATKGEAEYRLASAGYFAAMKIPLLQGRLFSPRDAGDAPDTAVISQSLARLYWPGENPIGRTIQFGNMDGDKQPLHIIGVVADVRDDGLDQPAQPTVYAHTIQRPGWWQISNLSYVLRAQGDPMSLIPAMRAEVQGLNRDVLLNFRAMDEVVVSSLDTRRFSLVIFGAFAVVALILAAAGVYGVMSYAVSQRVHEIGVRIALGARHGDVLRMILAQGMRLALAGIAVGLVSAYGVTRLIAGMLHNVSPADPLTFASIAALLALVALLACYLPARRATRVDPMVALRCE